jgi:ubiquinone/menaquinone biosynthesis C-methylase UbiE
MMDFEELVAILRCLSCSGALVSREPGLVCSRCGRAYPVVADIPVIMEADGQTEVWQRYFRQRAETLGDSEAANSYFNLRSFRLIRDNILKLVGQPAGLSILDIGCGTGHFTGWLAEANRLVGVDISQEMAAFARNKGLATVRSTGKKLPFTPASFSLVIATNIIQSFPDGGPFVAEAARVLRPGGRLILCAPNRRNPSMAALRRIERLKYKHLSVYSAAELRWLFKAAGLRVASLLFFYFPLRTVVKIPGDARIGWLGDRLSSSVAVEGVKPG